MGTLSQTVPTPLTALGRQDSFLSSGRAGTNLSRGHLRPVTASEGLILEEVDFEAPKKQEVIPEIDSSDEYDTDIEIDEKCSTPLDLNGSVVYRHTCRKLGILPIKSMGAMLAKPELRLRHRVIGPVGALALSNALLINNTVTVLHIDGNDIGPKGTRYICWMLLESEIKDLSLSDNNIGHLGAGAIAECLAQSRTLLKLNLSSNDLGSDEAKLISKALQMNRDLKEIDLCKNNFDDDACKFFAKAIAENDSLRKMDMSWNKIRKNGTADLVRGLLRNVTMRCFNLSGNGAGNEGAKSIAQLLRRNATLLELDISENRIFDSGIIDLSKALKVNQTIEIVRLANNPITSYGALGLLEILCKNKENVIKVLDLSTTHIHTQTMGKIAAIKEDNPEFHCLYAGTLSTPISKVGKSPEDKMTDQNPLLLLKWYISAENLRLLDIFQRFDKDGSMQVSRQEFVEGLRSIEVPMSVAQIETLMEQLDQDGDGEIDFAELLQGERELTRKLLKADMKKKQRDRMEREKQKKASSEQNADGIEL